MEGDTCCRHLLPQLSRRANSAFQLGGGPSAFSLRACRKTHCQTQLSTSFATMLHVCSSLQSSRGPIDSWLRMLIRQS